jgi:hypothetical protein
MNIDDKRTGADEASLEFFPSLDGGLMDGSSFAYPSSNYRHYQLIKLIQVVTVSSSATTYVI